LSTKFIIFELSIILFWLDLLPRFALISILFKFIYTVPLSFSWDEISYIYVTMC
jgi:hypothetical protein